MAAAYVLERKVSAAEAAASESNMKQKVYESDTREWQLTRVVSPFIPHGLILRATVTAERRCT